MADNALTPLLFQGVSRELQDMLLHSPAPSRDFRQYANHLQTLDNRYRQHQQQVHRSKPSSQLITQGRKKSPSPRRGRSQPRQSPPKLDTGEPMDLSNQRRPLGPSRRENNLCFRCGSSAHHIRECPKPDTRSTQIRAAALYRPSYSAAGSPSPSPRRLTPSPDHTENGASLS